MGCGVINALAHSVTVIGAGRSRSQEWLLRARVLRDSVHNPRSNRTTQRDDGVVESERRSLQVNGLHRHLEQLVRVGGFSRFHMAT